MATYRLIEVPENLFHKQWAIERVVPGEKPERLPFEGRWAEAEAEMNRLSRLDGAARSIGAVAALYRGHFCWPARPHIWKR